MSLLADTLALFLALVLAAAALHKIRQPGRLGAAAANLAGVSAFHGGLLATAAATAEILTAAALVVPFSRLAGALAALAIWALYAFLVWRAAARGTAFDCGCTLFRRKSGGDRLSPVSPLFLALCASLLALLPSASDFGPQAVFAACALFCLRFAAEQIIDAPFTNHKVPNA